MDGRAFDNLTRDVTAPRSRRGLLAGFGGGTLASILGGAGLHALQPDDAAAKKKRRKRKRRRGVRATPAALDVCALKARASPGLVRARLATASAAVRQSPEPATAMPNASVSAMSPAPPVVPGSPARAAIAKHMRTAPRSELGPGVPAPPTLPSVPATPNKTSASPPARPDLKSSPCLRAGSIGASPRRVGWMH
jgi:hypothetical protein